MKTIMYCMTFCCTAACSSAGGGMNILCWMVERITPMIGSRLK